MHTVDVNLATARQLEVLLDLSPYEAAAVIISLTLLTGWTTYLSSGSTKGTLRFFHFAPSVTSGKRSRGFSGSMNFSG